jgi:transcriptional regulator with GAF, ATPase, and Fis domain
MDDRSALYEIARLLLCEPDAEHTPQALLERILARTGAERGFLVLRAAAGVEGDDGFEQKFDVRYDRELVSAEERRFSRSVVRHALETGELVASPDLPQDPRFTGRDSVRRLGPVAVLAVPLRHRGTTWGVLYLERPGARRPFPATAQALAAEAGELAGAYLHGAVERTRLLERNKSLEHGLMARHDFRGIRTQHPRMLALLKSVAQAAGSDATVLLRGESGTGKDLLAQALHWNSPRAGKPFVTVHCAALPPSLLESELFGHVKGAFSGADRERAGRLATADGGTLFLDEIGDIPLEIQAKLLRFLQFGEIQRVGSDRTETVDVRLVAATLQDLPALAAAGRFRQDLYYRLKVVELSIPPLRERAGDVPLLVEHFLQQHWKRKGPRARFTPEAERLLLAHAWPGNVRELEHAVERACVLAGGPELGPELLPAELQPAAGTPGPAFARLHNDELKAAREAAVDEVERTFLGALLERHGGNLSRASREAGLQRAYLQKLLRRHRIARPAEGS